jgi:putative oxidoreductase
MRRAAGERGCQEVLMKKESLVDLGLLVLRLALGAVFVLHGLQKFFPQLWGGGPGIGGFAQFLQALGVPQPQVMAYLVAGWELVGGAFVGLGVLPRIAALGLLADMIVAILRVHLPNGFFTFPPGVQQITPGQVGFEFALTLGSMALAVVLAGPGSLALQRAVAGRKKK